MRLRLGFGISCLVLVLHVLLLFTAEPAIANVAVSVAPVWLCRASCIVYVCRKLSQHDAHTFFIFSYSYTPIIKYSAKYKYKT
jgi:hypothetical protein